MPEPTRQKTHTPPERMLISIHYESVLLRPTWTLAVTFANS